MKAVCHCVVGITDNGNLGHFLSYDYITTEFQIKIRLQPWPSRKASVSYYRFNGRSRVQIPAVVVPFLARQFFGNSRFCIVYMQSVPE